MYNIVTSIAVDTHKEQDRIVYPQLGRQHKRKREIYWQCVYTFCLSSLRHNPEKPHLVYTNDSQDVIVDGFDLKKSLIELGVEVIVLAFEKCAPGEYSKTFHNAFYKLEVIDALSRLTLPSLLVDSDCLWTKPDPELDRLMVNGDKLLVQDTYQRSSDPNERRPQDLSMIEMGQSYATLGLYEMRTDRPVWYGGELIGGSPENLRQVAERLIETINFCKKRFEEGNGIYFPNDRTIFDNDEFISSYVFSTLDIDIIDTWGRFSKRLWTGYPVNNVNDSDKEVTIWHLPGEKVDGLQSLFSDLVEKGADYWLGAQINDMRAYMGKHVGIPQRKFSPVFKMKHHGMQWAQRTVKRMRDLSGS